MSELKPRAQQLIAAGRSVAPAHRYALLPPHIDPRATPSTAAEAGRGPDWNADLGLQPNGRFLALLDLDSHTVGQYAAAANAAVAQALPQVTKRIAGQDRYKFQWWACRWSRRARSGVKASRATRVPIEASIYHR